MKTYIDLLKVICSGEFTRPLWEIPKTMYDIPRKTILGNMYYISMEMIIDGKY